MPPQPWRNGGGSTRELLAWPAADRWIVRVSVARIEQDGPFSSFPGVERWFAVLHGEGVTLQFTDSATELRQDSQPLRFDGATAPGCTLSRGATQDLNLMVRSEAGRGVMRPVTADTGSMPAANFRAVYTTQPAALHIDDRLARALPAGTLAWSDDAAGERWHLTPRDTAVTLRAWWLEFTPLDAFIAADGPSR